MKLKIGIIGCGAIGTIIAKFFDNKKEIKIVALNDIEQEKEEILRRLLKSKPKNKSIEELISLSNLVIETASKNSVEKILNLCIKKRTDILIMSVGGLINNMNLLASARKKKVNIYIPSGAVAGIDAIKAANNCHIDSVVLTTTKPINSLKNAPYILENNINIDKNKKSIVFEGNAINAVSAFPNNINVSATVSLAGIGPLKTKVKIIADPESKINCHELKIKGDFGEITTITKNIPCPNNSKTSYIAALSGIEKIKEIIKNIKIGT